MKTPESKGRKTLAVAVYTFMIIWLIYSQHRMPATPSAVVKQAVAVP